MTDRHELSETSGSNDLRGMVDQEDLALFEGLVADLHVALTKPRNIANLKAAVDVLADASAPFGRLRLQLNQAIARVAVRGVDDA